jgi:hypothetical protein
VIKQEDIAKHVVAEIDCVKKSMEQPSESVPFSERHYHFPLLGEQTIYVITLLSMFNVSFKLSVSFEGSFSLDDGSSLDGTDS